MNQYTYGHHIFSAVLILFVVLVMYDPVQCKEHNEPQRESHASSSSAGAQYNSGYKDTTIHEICDSYFENYKILEPLINKICEDAAKLGFQLENVRNWLDLSSDIMQLSEELEGFMEAKEAYDDIDVEKLTKSQLQYYESLENQINSSILKYIIMVYDETQDQKSMEKIMPVASHDILFGDW